MLTRSVKATTELEQKVLHMFNEQPAQVTSNDDYLININCTHAFFNQLLITYLSPRQSFPTSIGTLLKNLVTLSLDMNLQLGEPVCLTSIKSLIIHSNSCIKINAHLFIGGVLPTPLTSDWVELTAKLQVIVHFTPS